MASLRLHHVYGLKGDIKDNVQYIDEGEILYPAGHHVIAYNIEKKTQRFIRGDFSSGASQITALAVSSAGKQKVLAVAEKGPKGAQISVYDVITGKKRSKTALVCNDMASKEFVSLSFSPDGKQLLAQGGAPDWTLVNFLWEKSKPLQVAQVSNQSGAAVHQCSYCPTDPSCVCVTGNGLLRFLRLEQSEFKSIQFSIGKREPQNYLCHTWVDDRILVGTDTGDILVFENAEFCGVLASSPANNKSVESIAAYSKGFVCGCEEGVLYVFERDEKEIYKQVKSFQIDGNLVKIKNLAVSPSEDTVTCTLENNQAFVLSLSNTDILKPEEMNFEPLAVPFHYSTITGLDVCVRKPLVVTCGVDKSVRVWNYVDRTLEVMQFFPEELHSVAFHPSGLHLLVGFSESLRFMNLLMDQIRNFKEFPIKNCREVRFSTGGQYFAAANNSVVQLFSTYNCEMIGNLRGHKARVTSISWRDDDAVLVSTSADGQVIEWRLKDNAIIQDYTSTTNKISFTSCATVASMGAFVVGSDHSLRQITDSKEAVKIDSSDALTQIAASPSSTVLYAGTDAGTVRLYPLPLAPHTLELDCHSGTVTRLRVSPDGGFLFTVGSDGCLAVFETDHVKDRSMTAAQAAASQAAGQPVGHIHEQSLTWAEEILVTKSDLEGKLNTMAELRNKVEELQYHNQMQLKLREMNFQEKMREISEKYHHELESNKEKYQALESSKVEMERRYSRIMEEQQQRHSLKVEELGQHHIHKMETESRRYKSLEDQLQRMRERWSDQRTKHEEAYGAELRELERSLEQRVQDERQRRDVLDREKAGAIAEFEETKTLMEEEADKEIDELKSSYDARLTLERMTTLRLKDENAILKVKFGALRDDIKERKDNIQKRNDKQRMLYDQIHGLEKDVEGHLKEIQERDSTIGDKVKRIFELRKKNQELEKFKFVLDYKIKELKRQIAPRQRDIKNMGEQITQMNTELNGYHKSNAYLQLTVRELRMKLDGMDRELRDQEGARNEVQGQQLRIRSDLAEITQLLQDPKHLKQALKRLYHRHVTHQVSALSGTRSDESEIYKRQRHYLERSVDALNEKLEKEDELFKKDNTRIMTENIALVKEINQLRREIQLLKSEPGVLDGSREAKGKAHGDKTKAATRLAIANRSEGAHSSPRVSPDEDLELVMKQQQAEIQELSEELGHMRQRQQTVM